jgi:FMN phosphatase YigB (HAD superfamily)
MTMIADGSSRWSSLEQFADEIRRLGLTAALLTNGTDTIPAEVAAPGLESHFDAIFNSADIAFVKPDIRAFDHVLDALAVIGPDVFFTDDSAAKLLGASVPRCQ